MPKAVVASLGNHYVSVDTGNLTLDTFQELIDTECPLGFKPFDPPLLGGFQRQSSACRSHGLFAVLQLGVIGSFRLFRHPSSRMAAAAWSDVEELEESPFRRVPCKREK